ncbi:MAG: glycosyltransferase family 4 protein [Pseudomonadota bacterium]
MKILMASEDLPGERIGGLGKHVVTLANALLSLGHEVAILGRDDGAVGAPDPAVQVGFNGRFIAAFDLRHLGWKELQMGVFNPCKRPWFARKIGRAIARHAAGFDVVHYHGHLPMAGLYVDPALNFVQTRHDQGSECITHLRFRDGAACGTRDARDCAGCIHPAPGPLRRHVSAQAVTRYRAQAAGAFARHKTIFVSDFLRRQFLRQLPMADLSRCRVIHNFIQYPLLARLAGRAQVQDGQVLLAGRIDAGKGFGEFLAAARGRLAPRAALKVVGDGPERAALQNAYAGGQVDFLGWQPYPEVIALTASSHVCVVPSVLEEPCATTVLEALALGRACIAMARGGNRELAAYQQYDGQLQLATSIDEMVAMLDAALARPPVTLPLPATSPMDVFSAVPKIIDCYRDQSHVR